jgi:hypothetical protein
LRAVAYAVVLREADGVLIASEVRFHGVKLSGVRAVSLRWALAAV